MRITTGARVSSATRRAYADTDASAFLAAVAIYTDVHGG